MTIRLFKGEFTVSPIALELSLDRCSHNCVYCFANLNDSKRDLVDLKALSRQLLKPSEKTLTGHLIKEKYPICISNLSDPFSKNNYFKTLKVLEAMQLSGNKAYFQTKGGEGIDEALQIIDYKALFYITISTLDDKLSKEIEPGAPSTSERIALVQKLKSLGHGVIVGINPLNQEWMPFEDFEKFLAILKTLKVNHVWTEILHFNSFQIANMTPKQKNVIGDSTLNEAKKRTMELPSVFYAKHCINLANKEGFKVFSIHNDEPCDFMSIFSNYYEKTLYTHNQVQFEMNRQLAQIKAQGNDLIRLTFENYLSYMVDSNIFHFDSSEADGYIYRQARQLYKNGRSPNIRKLIDVLRIMWNLQLGRSLINLSGFYYEVDEDGKEIVDRNGDKVLLFCK